MGNSSRTQQQQQKDYFCKLENYSSLLATQSNRIAKSVYYSLVTMTWTRTVMAQYSVDYFLYQYDYKIFKTEKKNRGIHCFVFLKCIFIS